MKKLFVLILIIVLVCNVNNVIAEDDQIITIFACTDKKALNYFEPGNGYVVVDDGSCQYMRGCTDRRASNYIDFGIYTIDDGSCQYLHCTFESGCNASDAEHSNYHEWFSAEDDEQKNYYLSYEYLNWFYSLYRFTRVELMYVR